MPITDTHNLVEFNYRTKWMYSYMLIVELKYYKIYKKLETHTDLTNSELQIKRFQSIVNSFFYTCVMIKMY